MELRLWRETLLPYDQAVRELLLKFEYLQMEYREAGKYCPILQVSGRVKSISSILAKCRKKSIDLDDLEEKIFDIAGIRIICQFVEDIELVRAMIDARQDMSIVSERDYVTKIKESGYRSYHLIIRYCVNTMQGSREIFAEVQIRTLGMNFWSTIEHSIQYKYSDGVPEHVRKKLVKAAQAIVVLDSQMSSVRREIMDAQVSLQIESGIISEILNTIENLYCHCNRREIDRIQEEFYQVYRERDLEKLERFRTELDLLAQECEAQDLKGEKGIHDYED